MTNEEIVPILQKSFDNALFEKLLTENKTLIDHYLSPYRTLLPAEDLRQAAYIGIWQAIEKYDPDQGAAFMTFARHYIKLCVTREIIKGGNNVRIPQAMYWQLNKYNRFLESFERLNGRKPSSREARYSLKCSADKIELFELCNLIRHADSLSTPIGDAGGELEDIIPDPADPFDKVEQRLDFENMSKELWAAVDALPELQAALIRARYKCGKTAAEAAQELGLSRGQVDRMTHKACLTLGRHTPKCKSYHEIYLSVPMFNHVGLRSFLNTRMSQTERAAFRDMGIRWKDEAGVYK